MKSKMKALPEYFPMEVLVLLVNRVPCFCKFYVELEQRNMAVKGLSM